jgi:glutaredoxin
MFDYLEYTKVDGNDERHDIEIYALSTCGFCKRALSFLKERDMAYRVVHVDQVPLELKNKAKAELLDRFKEHVSFPFAVIDGKEVLVGFIEADWRKTLVDGETRRG